MQLTGVPQLFDIDPLKTSTAQAHMLGAIGYDAIGRRYRYSKAGALALVRGNLLQGPARDVQFTDLAVVSGAANQKTIVATNGTTAVVVGDFDTGTASVTVTPGIGQSFVIKSHSAAANGAALTINLFEDIQAALSTASKLTISPNVYSGVIVSPTTRTGKTVGVAVSTIPALGFGWIGDRGRFAVLSDATVAAVGEGLSPSTSTAGCVTKAVTLLERIGTAPVLGISAKCEPADLEIL